jgi:hypothetical protein
MADLFVLILLPLVLIDLRVVAAGADEEVVAVDEVALIVEDEVVADVALAADVVADVEVLEVAVAEGKLLILLKNSQANQIPSTNRGGFGDFQGKKQTF